MRLPLDRLQQQYVVRCERNAAEAFGCTQRARDAVARRPVATEGGDRVPAADQTVPHLRSLHPLVVPPARDLAHNLVLAHDACNSRKSDLLGGEQYLERWARFVSDHDSDLQQVGSEAGLLVDRATSVTVAEWSYGHAERVQAEVWLGGTDYGHLSAGWRRLLPSERSVDEPSR